MLYENIARNVDTVARIGGDEFLIILSDLKDSSGAQRVAHKIVDKLALLTRIDGRKITIGASIGIAIFEAGDENDFDKLIKTADEAMYQAKQQGKSEVALA
jgi:diguanylate cyclase (GGDEF)-like protein